MSGLDWVVVCVYILGMIGLSVYLGRGQTDQADYYVGGRNLPWWAVGISTMATQSSAISFISIPAFVALKQGGGLSWLQYELAVPLAMIFIMVFLLPFFRRLELVSVYEYLEYRFGPGARLFLSAVFLVSRGFGTGVGVYVTALVLSAMLGIPIWATILLIGVVTIIYDTIGGMKAVVYSDVIQMGILVVGVLLSVYFAADVAGGFAKIFTSLSPERWNALDPSTGLGDGGKVPFWAYLVGGFFLYCSYYGTDQTQVQRELSTPSMQDTRRSLMLNGFARFPLTLLYILLGLACGAAYVHSPALAAAVPAGKLDYLVPKFILLYLPAGVRGLILSAILAAAMSSLDSSLNSLSAASMRDFITRGRKMARKKELLLSKLTTVFWGAAVTACAFAAGNIDETVVEAVNKVGSAFYGPILAAFVLGVATRDVTGKGVVAGVLTGVLCNCGLWLSGSPLHWMWWNFIGFAVTVSVALVASCFTVPPLERQVRLYTLAGAGQLQEERKSSGFHRALFGYFILILGIVLASSLLVG